MTLTLGQNPLPAGPNQLLIHGGTINITGTYPNAGTNTNVINNSIIRADAAGSMAIGGRVSGPVYNSNGLTSFTNTALGILDVTNASASLLINPTSWQNLGSVAAQASGTLNATTSTPTNFSAGTLTGGTWKAISGGTLRIGMPSSVTTNAATIVVDGATSHFYRDSGTTNAIASLSTNSGSLTVGSGQSFAPAIPFTDSGVLIINGTFAPSALTLASGGTLKGSGTISAPITAQSGASVAPGNSPGILNTGNFNLQAGSALEIEIGGLTPGNTATNHDQVNVTGTVTLADNITALRYGGFNPAAGNAFKIINNDGIDAVFGTFNSLPEGASFTSDNVTYFISYIGGDGNDVVLSTQYTVFVVTNPNDSGSGSLRQAIIDANAISGRDQIQFSIPGVGPFAIHPQTALPSITENVIVDATSQPGYSGTPLVELDGDNVLTAASGLQVNSNSALIKGLSIVNWSSAGLIFNGNNNQLQSSYIGVHANGTTAGANVTGVLIQNAASGNTIGGVSSASGNVISGNSGVGVLITGSGTAGNTVLGNYIGTNASGTSLIRNASTNVRIDNARNNVIGGTAAGSRNVIAGSSDNIWILGAGSTGNRVEGNYLGLNAAGDTASARTRLAPGRCQTRPEW
ncbi:MAG: hypothetical protein WKF77_00900 [Planctomycetaceae bacterium]